LNINVKFYWKWEWVKIRNRKERNPRHWIGFFSSTLNVN
jgi:hypothetical protein